MFFWLFRNSSSLQVPAYEAQAKFVNNINTGLAGYNQMCGGNLDKDGFPIGSFTTNKSLGVYPNPSSARDLTTRVYIPDLTKWFLAPSNYTAVVDTDQAINTCRPTYCDVTKKKKPLNWVIEALSTIGGLWTVIIGVCIVLWSVLNFFPCMGSEPTSYVFSERLSTRATT